MYESIPAHPVVSGSIPALPYGEFTYRRGIKAPLFRSHIPSTMLKKFVSSALLFLVLAQGAVAIPGPGPVTFPCGCLGSVELRDY
jgi:hypothetical protein